MGRWVRSCLQSLLKLVNSVIGMVGMALILYALWMLRVWYRQFHDVSVGGTDSTPPWFICTFLGLGVSLDWEEDFPDDPTGKFNEFKNFVRLNFEMCEWIGLGIVAAQAISILLAMVLRALGPYHGSYYDSDDDYTPARLPLLRNQIQHTSRVMDPHLSLKSDSWKVNR